MTEPEIALFIVAAVVIALIAVCAMLAARYGSLRGAMFGARVTRELGAIDGAGGAFSRSLKARVFELEASGRARIGLEFRTHGKRSYATLDAAAARQLAGLLESAARRG
jgi:hypothetical protein